MKKQIKWTAALSAAAVMTALAPAFSAPALAQPSGWVEENGSWMFYDTDGYVVTDTWKKHDNQWYYLDEDGNLSLDRQIDEYYVGTDGKRVASQWVKVANDDDWGYDDAPEFYWYYYGTDGKATTSRFRTINNKTHYFDSDGRMVTGLAEIDGATYYFGGHDDGAMRKGWVQLEDENSDAEPYWCYFDSNGKRVENQIDKRINGHYYTFKDGKMQTGWYKMPAEAIGSGSEADTDAGAADETAASGADATPAGEAAADTAAAESQDNGVASDSTAADTTANGDEADNSGNNASDNAASDTTVSDSAASDSSAVLPAAAGYQYYDSDGKRASGWRTIEGIPGVSQEDELYKFYFKNGQPCFARTGVQIFFISSGRYAFNTKGEMQTGLQTVVLEDGSTAIFYFGNDGAMKTGKQTIFNEDEGVNQTWFFHTDGEQRGQGYHGIRDNAIYNNGLRLQANAEFRYASVSFEGRNYLVNAAGTIQKATASAKSAVRPDLGAGFRDFKDLNEQVWTVDVNGIIQ